MRPQLGQVINNKYRLIRLIGDGGMGSVFEARHEVLGTKFALKFLHPELSRRSGLVQRFLQEARVSAQIQSPHVVRVTDVDQTSGGLAFIVLEYLEGKTLQTLYEELYKARQRLSYFDALEYAMQMLEGVEAAHRAGVVHRDLKPDNVMITKDEKGAPRIKLLDFGIAKLKVTGQLERGLTRPGVVMGTPEYMAPEQAFSADAVDARADIFSLGVMVFEMLAGRRPVGGDEAHQIASQYLAGNVAQLRDLAPGIPPELAKAVHRAIAARADDRYADVAELRAAIEPFARAARAPSAGAGPTPLLGGGRPAHAVAAVSAALSPGTPPTNAPANEAGSVPRTLATEDGDAEEAVLPQASPSAPDGRPMASMPNASGEPSRRSRAESVTKPEPRTGQAPAGAVTAAMSPVVPATVSGAYAEISARPGGTDVGRQLPSTPTRDMEMAVAAGPAPSRRAQARSSGGSFLLMLLVAAGISGAVVGGVYLAHETTRPDDSTDTSSPAPTLSAEPPPSPTPATAAPGPSPTPKTTLPAKPPPAPATTSSPHRPAPTTTPGAGSTKPGQIPAPGLPGLPGGPIIVLPSAFPPLGFPMPGQPQPQPSQPQPQPTATPTTPPPAPTPAPTTSSPPRRRTRIPIPVPKN